MTWGLSQFGTMRSMVGRMGLSPLNLELPLITKITGQLIALEENVLTLRVGAFEYEVLIPEFTRRQLQSQIGQEISLHTIEYLEGNPMQGRMTPRLIGFLSEIEREFFDLFCSVDGVGVKKALRAMVRPVKEVATAIEEQDATLLSALPGIGPAMSERIIAKLRRKVPKFALMVAQQEVHEAEVESDVVVGDLRGLAAFGPFGERRPEVVGRRACRPRRNTPTCRASCRRSISRATSKAEGGRGKGEGIGDWGLGIGESPRTASGGPAALRQTSSAFRPPPSPPPSSRGCRRCRIVVLCRPPSLPVRYLRWCCTTQVISPQQVRYNSCEWTIVTPREGVFDLRLPLHATSWGRTKGAYCLTSAFRRWRTTGGRGLRTKI